MPSSTQKMDGLGLELEVDLPKSGGIHEKQYQGRTCNYCLGQGHWKRECPVLKSNSRFYQGVRPEKPVALAVSVRAAGLDESDFRSVDPGYRSYVSQGFVSLVGSGKRADSQPFERLLIDCVGPLPKSKAELDRDWEGVALVNDGCKRLLKKAKFSGPYAVVRQSSDQNYIIATPDRVHWGKDQWQWQPQWETLTLCLNGLLSEKAKFEWSPLCQQAFEEVKLVISSAPVLAAPRMGEPFKLQVDASKLGAGAVLLQIVWPHHCVRTHILTGLWLRGKRDTTLHSDVVQDTAGHDYPTDL
ncbi:hypothetical protein D4764_0211250 [Takifugu flavidus]|uniref:Reverse transcriptase/retrotransposon-derived protein RNase H-like domain-containing protein n=1 Tax=Takifugu flavidus TaxID=433684 RepID=A0A5C6MHU0_9TELE|nr:hypothetical protein D4764_0211250 [Takifugu flavidus]